VAGGVAAAAPKDAAAAGGADAARLRDVWQWLLHYQQQQPPAAAAVDGSKGMSKVDRPLFQQMEETTFDGLCGSLVEAARAYMSASHLFWSLWGMIQSRISEVDWDFVGYARQRRQQYLLTKPAGMPLDA
jgi:hypothetical protein